MTNQKCIKSILKRNIRAIFIGLCLLLPNFSAVSAQPSETDISQASAAVNQAKATDFAEGDIPIAAFGLLGEGQGWVLRGNELLSSADLGRSWQNISPSALKSANAATVAFENGSEGWMVL